MAKQCAICNKSIGALGVKYTTSDNHNVCWKCIRKAGYGANAAFGEIKQKSLNEIMNHKTELTKEKEQSVDNLKKFIPTTVIEKTIEVDEKQEMFRLSGIMNLANIYNLSSISSYELVENGSAISSGGLGRAALGAVTFGGAGAIVGAVTGKKKSKTIVEKLQIKIMLNDLKNPVVYIELLKKPVKQNSKDYANAIKKADNILSSLNTVVSNISVVENEPVNAANTFSTTDEIRNYKELLDDGIITQEEFEAKKKELLNL